MIEKTQEVQAGTTTSEFMGTVATSVVALVAALASASERIQITALVCMTAVVCMYIWSRTHAKTRANR
jgi:cell division protein ZapA (FtsZ GTPase activity inhibitor)